MGSLRTMAGPPVPKPYRVGPVRVPFSGCQPSAIQLAALGLQVAQARVDHRRLDEIGAWPAAARQLLAGAQAVDGTGQVAQRSLGFGFGAHGTQRLPQPAGGLRQRLPGRRVVALARHPGVQGLHAAPQCGLAAVGKRPVGLQQQAAAPAIHQLAGHQQRTGTGGVATRQRQLHAQPRQRAVGCGVGGRVGAGRCGGQQTHRRVHRAVGPVEVTQPGRGQRRGIQAAQAVGQRQLVHGGARVEALQPAQRLHAGVHQHPRARLHQAVQQRRRRRAGGPRRGLHALPRLADAVHRQRVAAQVGEGAVVVEPVATSSFSNMADHAGGAKPAPASTPSRCGRPRAPCRARSSAGPGWPRLAAHDGGLRHVGAAGCGWPPAAQQHGRHAQCAAALRACATLRAMWRCVTCDSSCASTDASSSRVAVMAIRPRCTPT
jgi:hypothetical protein